MRFSFKGSYLQSTNIADIDRGIVSETKRNRTNIGDKFNINPMGI